MSGLTKQFNEYKVAELKDQLNKHGIVTKNLKKVALIELVKFTLNSDAFNKNVTQTVKSEDSEEIQQKNGDFYKYSSELLLKVKQQSSEIQKLLEVNAELSVKIKQLSETQQNFINTNKCDIALNDKSAENCGENGNKKPSLLVLADSHGRGLADILINMQQKFQVTVYFKPNATFSQVTEDIRNLTANFNYSDYVVVIAGTNDVKYNFLSSRLTSVIKNCFHTNLLVCSIPYRYDTYNDKNELIHFANKKIFHIVYKLKRYSDVLNVIDLNKGVFTSDYTIHGLHYNKSGKQKLCHKILNSISQVKSNEYSSLKFLKCHSVVTEYTSEMLESNFVCKQASVSVVDASNTDNLVNSNVQDGFANQEDGEVSDDESVYSTISNMSFQENQEVIANS